VGKTPDRESVIELLEKLGDPDDSQSLAAARELHGFVSGSGLSWDDLLVPDGEAAATPQSYEDDDDDFDGAEENESSFDDQVVPAGDAAADVKRIGQLLNRSDISASLREELEGYKEDIEEGDFTASDRQYIEALQKRLSGSSKKRPKEG
jgi:hypothetical protein